MAPAFKWRSSAEALVHAVRDILAGSFHDFVHAAVGKEDIHIAVGSAVDLGDSCDKLRGFVETVVSFVMPKDAFIKSLPVSRAIVYQVIGTSCRDTEHISLIAAAGISFDFRFYVIVHYNKPARRLQGTDFPVVSVYVGGCGIRITEKIAVQAVAGGMV